MLSFLRQYFGFDTAPSTRKARPVKSIEVRQQLQR